jgi:hypothetical protein
VEFKAGTDVHVVSSLMKLYLRELPEPLLTFDMACSRPPAPISSHPNIDVMIAPC